MILNLSAFLQLDPELLRKLLIWILASESSVRLVRTIWTHSGWKAPTALIASKRNLERKRLGTEFPRTAEASLRLPINERPIRSGAPRSASMVGHHHHAR